MPSYNKSFNFRNGVQVDDDNFIVNPNGLVGIGTSIPTEFLDVYGTAKITGLVTTTNLAVTGVSTFYSDVKIGSGIALYAPTGIVSATAFYGDGSNMTGVEQVAVDGWIVNAGNISTTSKVGIGTTLPRSQLDVVGGVTVSGIVTALGFDGYEFLIGSDSSSTKNFKVKVAPKTSNHRYFGTGSNDAYLIDGKESPFLTLLPGKTYVFDQADSSNTDNRLRFYLEADRTTPYNTNVTTSLESPGTFGSYTQIIVTDTTPVVLHYQSSSSAYMGNAAQFNSNIVNTPYQITTLGGISATVGTVTAYSFVGFGTNIEGINATNITNGTLSNSRLPQSISITGILTASSGIITSLTSTNLNNIGIATLGITSISNLTVGGGVTITSAGIFAPTGIITAPTFVGGLVGIASTARDLTSNARVNITDIQSQTSSIGISTVSSRLYAESIGVGTNFPSGDIHIRKNGQSTLQVTSDTAEAIVAVGRSTTLTGSNGALIFGNIAGIYQYSNSKTLDVVNYGTGSLNQYLHYGSSGVGTGNFNWLYGQNANNPLMSLTYQGNLGIGITNPTNKLQVSGDVLVSSLVSGNISVTGNISATGAGTSVSTNILYVYGGKSQILNSDGSEIFPPGDGNLNLTLGISTFYDIQVTNQIHVGDYINDVNNSILITPSGIGIGTDDLSGVNATFYAADNFAVFGLIGIGTEIIENEDTNLYVVGNSEFYGNITATGIITASSFSGNSTTATYADRAGITTNVIGGIASVSQLNVTGVTTLTSIVGTSLSITGISTIANFRMSPVGTGATVGGIGVVTYYGDGSGLININLSSVVGVVTYADRAGIATYADNAGIATNVIGGIASVTSLDVSGISTLGTVEISSGIITATTGIVTYYGDGSNLTNVVSASGYASNAGISSNVIGGIGSITELSVSGVTTSQNGFTSGIGVTDPVQITVSGNTLTFNVVGVGSTSLTLF